MRTPEGDSLTALVLPIFALNAEILAAAEMITGDHPLTPASWQVLGSTLVAPLPVPEIARRLGHTRQSVQRLANSLTECGWAQWVPNGRRPRSPLLSPTPAGRQALHELDIRQHPWANEVGAALGQEDLSILASLLRRLTAASSDHRRRVTSPGSVPVMDEGGAGL